MRLRTAILFTAALVGNPAVANDDCNSPTLLLGTGTYAFDNSSATTGSQGQGNPFCPGIGSDLWYRWTAPSNGTASLSLCGQTAIDSNIAVYAGGLCPTTTSIVCDDDACGLQSFISWTAVSGGTYMLQIGGSGGAAPGSGTFTLDLVGPPANDDCATPLALGTAGGANYDNSGATMGAQGQATACQAFDKDLWFTWTAPLAGTATLETCFQTSDDTMVAVYDATTCPTSAEIACDDNGCGLQSTLSWLTIGGHVYLVQVGSTPGSAGGGGSFTITHVPSGPTGTPYCSGDGSGTACPCGNAGAAAHGCANSVDPAGAALTAIGNAAVAFDTLELHGVQMPTTATALFFQGTSPTGGGLGVVFGDGLRCAGGTVIRLGTKTNAGGASAYGGPLGDVPISVRGAVPSGGATRDYQVWYRNAAAFCTGATFNLSNGLEIVWS